jgi:hypothetical protein
MCGHLVVVVLLVLVSMKVLLLLLMLERMRVLGRGRHVLLLLLLLMLVRMGVLERGCHVLLLLLLLMLVRIGVLERGRHMLLLLLLLMLEMMRVLERGRHMLFLLLLLMLERVRVLERGRHLLLLLLLIHPCCWILGRAGSRLLLLFGIYCGTGLVHLPLWVGLQRGLLLLTLMVLLIGMLGIPYPGVCSLLISQLLFLSASLVSTFPLVVVRSPVVVFESFVVRLKGFLRDFVVLVWLALAFSMLKNSCAVYVHNPCSGLWLLLSLFQGKPVEGIGSFCLLSWEDIADSNSELFCIQEVFESNRCLSLMIDRVEVDDDSSGLVPG